MPTMSVHYSSIIDFHSLLTCTNMIVLLSQNAQRIVRLLKRKQPSFSIEELKDVIQEDPGSVF